MLKFLSAGLGSVASEELARTLDRAPMVSVKVGGTYDIAVVVEPESQIVDIVALVAEHPLIESLHFSRDRRHSWSVGLAI